MKEMTITFVSNFLNHHQIPLCDAFVAIPDVEFKFIATEKVPDDRIRLGYKYEFDHLSYYREAIEEKDIQTAEKLCYDSDTVIIGSAPISFVRQRLKEKKLTFTYNERWFKKGFWNHPGDVWRAIRDFTLTGNENFYQLCASAYTAADSNRILAFPGRKFRWGYFPEVRKYSDINNLMKWKRSASILWVARLIELKHPEVPIYIAKRLKDEGYQFELNMIGSGELEDYLKRLISKNNLKDNVRMLGSMSPEDVREHMQLSQIFLFTSDRNEGWGAVLNEAMNSGCAVVASHAIGSVPYLVRHGENGYIYSSGNNDELFYYVKKLLSSDIMCEKMGKNAYLTISDMWNANVAAGRLYAFAKAKLNGGLFPIPKNGPFSYDFGKLKNT